MAAALYVLSCREPGPFRHKAFVRPLWKQALGSTIHCLAGDATGIVFAAVVTAALGLPMWLDVVAEYALGFGFGLLVFQALFMKDMLGGSYAAALRRSFMPEWLSMNAVMAGMVPVMGPLMGRDMRAMEATSLRFWGVMSLATLAGAAVADPVNAWLVAAKLKHGMGTVRALGAGGHPVAVEARRDPAVAHGPAAASPGANPAARHAAVAGPTGGGYGGMAMETTADGPSLAAVALLTLLLLGAGVVLADLSGGFGTGPAAMDLRHGGWVGGPRAARRGPRLRGRSTARPSGRAAPVTRRWSPPAGRRGGCRPGRRPSSGPVPALASRPPSRGRG